MNYRFIILLFLYGFCEKISLSWGAGQEENMKYPAPMGKSQPRGNTDICLDMRITKWKNLPAWFEGNRQAQKIKIIGLDINNWTDDLGPLLTLLTRENFLFEQTITIELDVSACPTLRSEDAMIHRLFSGLCKNKSCSILFKEEEQPVSESVRRRLPPKSKFRLFKSCFPC